MLPEKAGPTILSADSAKKLDSYYQRFCEGDNNRLYGLSHMVFACHAAFPLLLTPELVNLVWLNFKTYPSGTDSAGIDRVVASDFLLSPLVRPVAANQFEVIPDIRNYLLYLLKDSRWFGVFGIGPFGDKRLNELATFLQQYLLQQKEQQDNQVAGFRQVNEWAALAYLEPDTLAYKMATAFKETFDPTTSERKDEPRQLRINMLVNRFGQQLESGIHAEAVANQDAFVNLKLYSNANNATLFGKQEMADTLLLKLDNTFIGENTSLPAMVELPMQKDIGERLERKKNNVQKVRSLLICTDRDQERAPDAFVSTYGLTKLRTLLQSLESSGKFDTQAITEIRHKATSDQILSAIKTLLQDANPEDSCFVYFAGFRGTDDNGNAVIYTSGKPGENIPAGTLSKTELAAAVQTARGAKAQQLVLFLDINGFPDNPWMTGNDIALYALRNLQEKHYDSYSEEANTAFNDAVTTILNKTNGRITYKDLQRYVNHTIKKTFHQPDSGALLQAALPVLDNYFLSYEKAAPDDKYLLIYNEQQKAWEVLEEDFTITPLSLTTTVCRYTDETTVEGVQGEFFQRDPVLFGGGTEHLQEEELYKGRPHRKGLSYNIVGALQAESGDLIRNCLHFTTFDKFSKWGYPENTGTLSDKRRLLRQFEAAPSYETLLVEVVQQQEQTAYQLSFYERVHEQEAEPVISSRIIPLEQLEATLKKLVRYVYLRRLGIPARYERTYEPLLVDIDCQWDTPDADLDLSKDNSFFIDEKAIVISTSGEITLHPFSINLFNNESFPVFYDCYLLFPDTTIVRLERSADILYPEVAVTINGNQPALLKKLAEESSGILLKVLFSREPMQLDFSQTPGN